MNYLLIINYVKGPQDLIVTGIVLFSINLFIVIVHNILLVKLYGRWKPVFDIGLWKKLIKEGIVIGFIQIAVQMINHFDKLIIPPMSDYTSLGIYNAAYRAMYMVLSVMAIFHILMSPILFESFKTSLESYKNFFYKYFKFMIYFGYGISVVFIILAVPYLNVFYDLKAYHGSVLCFQILMLTLFFVTINSPLHNGLLSAHKEKTLLGIVVFQLTCNIISNFILIPIYGILGAAYSTVLTEVVGLPFYIYYFRKVMPIKQFKNFIIATISVIPMGLFLYHSTIYYVFRAAIGIIILIATAVILLRIFSY